MKAAVCREFREPLSIEDVTLREPIDDEVQVSTVACAICHSDISFMEGDWGGQLPAVYGHEASGVVSAVGNSASKCRVGDPVLVTLIRSCGVCPSCSGGSPATCEEPYDRLSNSPLRDCNGNPLEQGLSTGAFAERVNVHQSQVQVLPDDIPLEEACLLSCGIITGFGAVANTAQVRPGSSVSIVGAGGVGLNCVQGARICGASQIIAVDLDEFRLKQASRFGATHGVLASKKMHREIREITGGRGVDFAFISVGAIQAYDQAVKYLAPQGEIVAVGMPPSTDQSRWSPVNLAFLGQSIRGSKMGNTVLSRDIPPLLELYRQGRLKISELISNRYRLDQINLAIDQVRKGQVKRNIIVFGDKSHET